MVCGKQAADEVAPPQSSQIWRSPRKGAEAGRVGGKDSKRGRLWVSVLCGLKWLLRSSHQGQVSERETQQKSSHRGRRYQVDLQTAEPT